MTRGASVGRAFGFGGRLELQLRSTFHPHPTGSFDTLYISPSGFVRVAQQPPCGASFVGSTTECSVATGYSGLVGPLVADFDAGAYFASEVWAGSWNLSALLPGGLPSPVVTAAGTSGRASAGSALVACATWYNMGTQADAKDDPSLAPSPDWSTHLCLYGDGGVRWRYASILGVPGYNPGTWTPGAVVIPGGGGPPNASSSTWIAGIRSLSAAFRIESTYDLLRRDGGNWSDAAFAGGDFVTGGKPLEDIVSAPGVKQGGSAALCAYNPIASISPACGAAGTVVAVAWAPPGCGLGFESLLGGGEASVALPQLQCVFGGVAVPASVSIPSNTSLPMLITCAAPALAAFSETYATNGSFAVPVELRMMAPTTTAPFAPGPAGSGAGPLIQPQTAASAASLGVGPSSPAYDAAAQTVAVSFDVHGVLAWPRPAGVLGGAWTALVPHELSFRYAAAAAAGGDAPACGCSETPGSVADACGVCGGRGTFVDCAGTCFGTAFVDSCGACVGGKTGLVKEYLKDCNGVCQPPGSTGCVVMPPTPTSREGLERRDTAARCLATRLPPPPGARS